MSTCSECPLRLTYGKTVIGGGLHPIPPTRNLSQHLRIALHNVMEQCHHIGCGTTALDHRWIKNMFPPFLLHSLSTKKLLPKVVITTLASITKPPVLPLQFISIIQYPRLGAITLGILKVHTATKVIFLTNVAAHYIQRYKKFLSATTISFLSTTVISSVSNFALCK